MLANIVQYLNVSNNVTSHLKINASPCIFKVFVGPKQTGRQTPTYMRRYPEPQHFFLLQSEKNGIFNPPGMVLDDL